MEKIIVYPIFLMVFALFLTTSCNSVPRFQAPTQNVFSKDSVSLDVHHIKLNENDRRFTECTDYVYFYPKIDGKPTDVHIRAEIGQNLDSGISISCGLYFYQGDPMKIDSKYSGLIKDKRLPIKEQGKDVYQTSYHEQMDILMYIKEICEKELHVEHIGCVFFKYDDMGELNVEITELCDSIRKSNGVNDYGDEFLSAITKTRLSKDLPVIFSDYNIEFKGPVMYYLDKVPYKEYAAKHNFNRKHYTPHVYLVNSVYIRLCKKSYDGKQ